MNTAIAKFLLTKLMTEGLDIENSDDHIKFRYVEVEFDDIPSVRAGKARDKYVMSLTTNDVLTLHRNNKEMFQIQIKSGEYSLIDIICLASHRLDGKDIFSYLPQNK